jgi:hypothetical protein
MPLAIRPFTKGNPVEVTLVSGEMARTFESEI